MNWRKNIKQWITNLIGLAIWVLTGVMWYKDMVDLLWEGVAGFIVGGVFFLLPDDFLQQILKRYLNKKVE